MNIEDYDDDNEDEEWDYLGDGYYTLDERAELRDIVRREKQEMRDDADSSKLGMIQLWFIAVATAMNLTCKEFSSCDISIDSYRVAAGSLEWHRSAQMLGSGTFGYATQTGISSSDVSVHRTFENLKRTFENCGMHVVCVCPILQF